jgi:transposase
MQSISTIGLDIAKSVFQVHGVDAAGQVVLRRQLRQRVSRDFYCIAHARGSPFWNS